MATLSVWQFGSADGASRATPLLEELARDDVIRDAALVEWVAGERKPRTRQLTLPAPSLDGGFWGLLFGLVFFVPLLGAAIGATTGAQSGSLADVGIDDHFINRVRDQVTPGTSALFLLSSGPVPERLRATFADEPHLISTDLHPDQEAAIRAVFAD